jgi:hypothetical protein
VCGERPARGARGVAGRVFDGGVVAGVNIPNGGGEERMARARVWTGVVC